MRTLGNILWLVLCGVWMAIAFVLGGLVLCVTVIGIPFGVQCFKLAAFSLWPFGKVVVRAPDGGGGLELVANVLWLLTFGWSTFVAAMGGAFLLAVTVIGIPFAVQAFKIGVMALWPFGRTVLLEGDVRRVGAVRSL